MTDVMLGTRPWSNTPSAYRFRRGDHRGPSPMFFDANGHRTYGFSSELLWSFIADAGPNIGTTYRELAEATGIAWRSIQSMARGGRQPTEAEVRTLAHALGVEPWDLCFA